MVRARAESKPSSVPPSRGDCGGSDDCGGVVGQLEIIVIVADRRRRHASNSHQRLFPALTSEQQRHWIDLGGELIRAGDAARDKAYEAGESVAHVSFELPRPDKSLEPGGTPPGRAVPKEKKSAKQPKPYDRKKSTPVVRARAAPQASQKQAQPPVIPPLAPAAACQPQQSVQCQRPPAPVVRARAAPEPSQSHRVMPPPPAATYQSQDSIQYQRPAAFTFFAPHPAVTPLEYYQYNDPTCPIPEEWIAYHKAAKAKEEEARQTARRTVQVKVEETAKRQEEDVRAMKRREEDVRAVKAREAKVVDWSRVLDPALMAE
ncbi:hypothetical protein BDZ89DRAFT_1171340 [Hymenopellis radicata]|nr:hypothetical protein BDZ89DRAFT_1171340 [Hymenopellis radicata]